MITLLKQPWTISRLFKHTMTTDLPEFTLAKPMATIFLYFIHVFQNPNMIESIHHRIKLTHNKQPLSLYQTENIARVVSRVFLTRE